jgi:hypothetical protein
MDLKTGLCTERIDKESLKLQAFNFLGVFLDVDIMAVCKTITVCSRICIVKLEQRITEQKFKYILLCLDASRLLSRILICELVNFGIILEEDSRILSE